MPAEPITPFTTVFKFFNETVLDVLNDGTAHMIELISPLVAAGFSIYVLLILMSYWRGSTDDPFLDFFMRMIAWALIITLGLNIEGYQTYVVPFVNGLGNDLANVIGPHFDAAASLDTMANAFDDAFLKLYDEADGISESLYAIFAIGVTAFFGGFFMLLAAAYILLSTIATGLLVAIGPLFIAAALFPATRDLFKNWVTQCLNFAFLTMLFSFVAQIEVHFINGLLPSELSMSAVFNIGLVCGLLIFVSLNLPNLAAALAGGIAISSMTRKLKLPNFRLPSFGKGTGQGGRISPSKSRDKN